MEQVFTSEGEHITMKKNEEIVFTKVTGLYGAHFAAGSTIAFKITGYGFLPEEVYTEPIKRLNHFFDLNSRDKSKISNLNLEVVHHRDAIKTKIEVVGLKPLEQVVCEYIVKEIKKTPL